MKRVEDLLAQARASGSVLLEKEAKELLAARGLPVVPCFPAGTPGEAVAVAGAVGYPVVLKALSPRIPHKTEAGAVILDLRDESAVREGFRRLEGTVRTMDSDAVLTVQKMVTGGREVIVGATRDRHFGPVLMCGLGGVLAEVLEDVAFRLIPVTAADARDMVASLRGAKVLDGYRGSPPADRGALHDLLVAVSDLVISYPEVGELDLNPVAVFERGLVILDARIRLAEPE